jgi:hypothetical protein
MFQVRLLQMRDMAPSWPQRMVCSSALSHGTMVSEALRQGPGMGQGYGPAVPGTEDRAMSAS